MTFFMRSLSLVSLFFGVVTLFSATTQFVFADAAVRSTFNRVGSSSGFKNICGDSSCVPVVVGGFVNLVVGLLGVALIAYIFYAGYLWMTSGGDEKNIEEAQQVIKNAVIGVFVVGFSFTIANVVIRLVTDTFQPPEPPAATEETPAGAAPGETPPPRTPTGPTSPFAAGCRRSTCTPACISQRCVGPLRAQVLFTCESGCQRDCESQCALDGAGLPGSTPPSGTAPWTVTPDMGECRNPAGFRTCRGRCEASARARVELIVDEVRRTERYIEEVTLCNDRCTRDNCSR